MPRPEGKRVKSRDDLAFDAETSAKGHSGKKRPRPSGRVIEDKGVLLTSRAEGHREPNGTSVDDYKKG